MALNNNIFVVETIFSILDTLGEIATTLNKNHLVYAYTYIFRNKKSLCYK